MTPSDLEAEFAGAPRSVQRALATVNSAEYHVDPARFEKDRLRDLTARTLGYHPIRLTYQQVVYQWDVVEPLLFELIRRGDHRRALLA